MKQLVSLSLASALLFSSFQTVPNQTIKIETPALQNRQTTRIILDNGLHLYVISDPNAKTSGAAFAVQAGSWDDPASYPGMAHLIEHMLFLGTKQNPEPKSFDTFLSEHGGKSNAFTGNDRTVYAFNIENSSFPDALQWMTDFFIDPSLSHHALEHEKHAVDEEYKKNLENDDWRSYMILKETGNPKHPHHRFSLGNLETLGKIPEKVMHQWLETHYSSSNMSVVVLSSRPLQKLVDLATKSLSAIPKRTILPTPLANIPLSSEAQIGHKIFIKPKRNVQNLEIKWVDLPTIEATPDGIAALKLLEYFINNKGPRSLSANLKEKGLARLIYSTPERESKEKATFTIHIDLTPKGISEVDAVIHTCFEAISLFKQNHGVPKSLFEEQKSLEKISWQYQNKQETFDEVLNLANQMVDVKDFSKFPQEGVVSETYPKEALNALANALTPASAIYLISDFQLNNSPFQAEKWMGGKYFIQPIDQKTLEKWTQANPSLISFPQPNPYVPDRLNLIAAPIAKIKLLTKKDSSKGKVYYAGDTSYKEPKAFINFAIHSQILDGSPKQVALADLYTYTLNEHLLPQTEPANAAGLIGVVSRVSPIALNLSVSGFSNKVPLLTTTIIETLKTFKPTPEELSRARAALQEQYSTQSRDLPLTQAQSYGEHLLVDHTPKVEDLLSALGTITDSDMTDFAKQFLHQAYVEGFVYGNLHRTAADKLWTDLKENIKSPLKKIQLGALQLPNYPYLISKETDAQGSGTLYLIETGPSNPTLHATTELLIDPISNAFFSTLRTDQKVAYLAEVQQMHKEHQDYLALRLQSGTYASTDLLARSALFLDEYVSNFDTYLPSNIFETVKTSRLSNLKTPPENMNSMFQRYLEFAFKKKGDFDYQDKLIKAVSNMSYDEFKANFIHLFNNDNRKRLAIAFQGKLDEDSLSPKEMTEPAMRALGTYTHIEP